MPGQPGVSTAFDAGYVGVVGFEGTVFGDGPPQDLRPEVGAFRGRLIRDMTL